MQSLSFYLKHGKTAANVFLNRYCRWMPDEMYLRIKFRLYMGYKLDLKNPKTFHEKLQWLKLYDRRPEYVVMVDKVKAKEYVASLIGEEHIVPNLGVWSDPDEIDFDSLPNQFVLKVNHNSGTGMYICKDKSKMDKEKVKAELRKGLKEDYYSKSREWAYKNVPRRILAEKYLSDEATSVGGDLNDYKFYCFDGKVKYCEVITGRNTKKQIDFFDLDWNHMEFNFDGYEFADNRPEKPKCFDKMIEIVGILCKNKPYSRIDLYVVGNNVYFGEITFFPASGFKGYHPKEWNRKLGDFITLPNKKQ